MEDRDLRERVARVETLLEEIEHLPNPAAKAAAVETMRALLDLYGEGLARIVEQVAQRGGKEALQALAADELVSHLLLLHGLHPIELEMRIGQGLEEVRPYLRSHGGDVEFLGVAEGKARLRLHGSCSGCPSSTTTLKVMVEQAVARAAPDLDSIEAEDAAAPRPGSSPVTFVPRAARAQRERSPCRAE